MIRVYLELYDTCVKPAGSSLFWDGLGLMGLDSIASDLSRTNVLFLLFIGRA